MFKILGLVTAVAASSILMMVYGMVAVDAMLTYGWSGQPWIASFEVMLLALIATIATSMGLGILIVYEYEKKNESIK